jgi:hypothetical protein
MKPILFILLSFTLFSCSLNKITKVTIENKNNYAIDVTIQANNISQTYANIQPKELVENIFDWTKIDKTDGEWHFIVKSASGRDSFAHGFFYNGELYSFVNLKCEGSQLKVEITE